MTKPYEFPQDVWDEAGDGCRDFRDRCTRANAIIQARIAAIRNRSNP